MLRNISLFRCQSSLIIMQMASLHFLCDYGLMIWEYIDMILYALYYATERIGRIHEKF